MDDTQFIDIQRLFQLVHTRGIHALSITQEGFSIAVKAMPPGEGAVLPAAAPVGVPTVVSTAPPVVEGYAIASPLVGIFYRSPSPDAPAFVEIGDHVEVGQTVGIVEAMKVFNEITADRAGVVLAAPAANGALVQAGQPLLVIDPSAS